MDPHIVDMTHARSSSLSMSKISVLSCWLRLLLLLLARPALEILDPHLAAASRAASKVAGRGRSSVWQMMPRSALAPYRSP